MRRIVFVLLSVMAFVIFVAGCGGGGGKKNGANSGTNFSVTVLDEGYGFALAGQTNFVLLGTDSNVYSLELARAITSSEIKSDSRAEFTCNVGTPKGIISDGTKSASIFEVRITQGPAGTWKSGDSYDRWKVGSHNYVLAWGSETTDYPGWSVWDVTAQTYIGSLSGYKMTIKTIFLRKDRSQSFSVKPDNDKMTPEQTAKITAMYR